MASNSFYLIDLENIIDRVALDSMMIPVLEHKKPDGTAATLAEVSSYNSLIAMNNEGVRDFAARLKEELRNQAGDSDE